MSVLQSRGELPEEKGRPKAAGVDLWASQWPGIWEMMSAPLDPDGGRRQGSTLTLFCSEGSVKLCINDRDLARSCFVSAVGVGEALAALERGLQARTLEWRKTEPYKGKKPRS
jgi:hypothetical protein